MSDWAARIGVKPDHTPPRRITVSVTRSKRTSKLQVLADDTSMASRAGTVLLTELADRLGLTGGLSEAMTPPARAARLTTPAAWCATWR
jgi:hypothetical protein